MRLELDKFRGCDAIAFESTNETGYKIILKHSGNIVSTVHPNNEPLEIILPKGTVSAQKVISASNIVSPEIPQYTPTPITHTNRLITEFEVSVQNHLELVKRVEKQKEYNQIMLSVKKVATHYGFEAEQLTIDTIMYEAMLLRREGIIILCYVPSGNMAMDIHAVKKIIRKNYRIVIVSNSTSYLQALRTNAIQLRIPKIRRVKFIQPHSTHEYFSLFKSRLVASISKKRGYYVLGLYNIDI